MSNLQALSSIFPDTAQVSSEGHLVIGDCDTVKLAAEFGTPLYIFDEATLRSKCAEFTEEFTRRYADTQVVYACKAFINRALAMIFKEEGLGLDVVSGGELGVARSAGFPLEKVYFHGSNKGPEELQLAIKWGVGRIVVDNYYELSLLNEIAGEAGVVCEILLRLSPGIDPHTHRHTATGIVDSKFGFPIVTGQGEEALLQAMAAPNLNLIGLHVHLGSPIFEFEPYKEAVGAVLEFAAGMKRKHGFELKEFSPGGGFAIQYTRDVPAPRVADYAEVIVATFSSKCESSGLPLPRLIVEPGRSMVGKAGVALYTVGAIKDIPGVRKYVSVDGGMADNIRPPLYGSRYEAVIANRVGEAEAEKVTIAGKFCESGDVLLWDISLPRISPGDLLAIPASGAYCLSMASNYNLSLKPAIVLVKGGKTRLIRRRETYDDLVSCDL